MVRRKRRAHEKGHPAAADGIQEYIETLRDLKASNAEQRYLSGLSDKIRAVEKQSIAAELETALFVSSAGMVLKLGVASVALTGSVLLVQGSPAELYARKGLYTHMVDLQSASQNWTI